MSDQATQQESTSKVNPQAESDARAIGWRPLEQFRGDPDHWVDAETYLKRGREYLPLIRAENARLKQQLDEASGKVQGLEQTLAAATEAIEGLKEYQTAETQRAAKSARVALVKELKAAREDGDTDREADILAGIVDLDSATREAKAKPAEKKPAAAPAPAEQKIDPVVQEWIRDNPWFETDRRRRGLALGIAEELRNDPATASLVGRPFFDKVAEEVEIALGERPTSKVDGGRPNGSPAGRAGSAKRERGYNDLPADAKDACDKMGKKLVGPGRAYKDDAAWRSQYAKDYFEGEA